MRNITKTMLGSWLTDQIEQPGIKSKADFFNVVGTKVLNEGTSMLFWVMSPAVTILSQFVVVREKESAYVLVQEWDQRWRSVVLD